jgi:RND family efflux transporter MFP subunit
MKKLLRRVIILVLLLVAGTGLYLIGEKYLWPPPDLSTIKAVGIVEAPEVNISSRIAGRIQELEVIEGDTVKRGQLICRIESSDIRNQLEKARADLLHAQADMADARRIEGRYRELLKDKVIPQEQYDGSATHLDATRAAVASAIADIHFYSDQLADTQIVSPIDGVVVNKALEIGEWANPGTTIVTVDDLSYIWARVDVQETDLQALSIGKSGTVTLPTKPPMVFSGRIIAIGQEGEFATEHDVQRGRQDIRTFYVKVRIFQAGGAVKPGMTAEVAFSRGNGTAVSSNQYRSVD